MRLSTTIAILFALLLAMLASVSRGAERAVINGNVQASSDACAAGDTLYIDGIRQTLWFRPKPGVRYVGRNGTKLVSDGAHAVFSFPDGSRDWSVEGIAFTGRAIYAVNAGAVCPTNVTVKGCTFDGNLYNGQSNPASIWELGWTNSTISDNVFTSWGDGGIEGFGFDNLIVTRNLFKNGMEGLHIIGHGPVNKVLQVTNNKFENMHRMNVEIQGVADHIICNDNIVSGENILPAQKDNMDSFGLSVVADGALKVDVHRNKIVSYERADGIGMRIAIELAADPTVNGALDCSDNCIDGSNAAMSVSTSLNPKVHDNFVRGSLSKGPQISFARFIGDRGQFIYNNGPDAGPTPTLTWDINRPWPIPSPGTPVEPPAVSVWTAAGGRAVLNGVPDLATSNVASVFQLDGKWYQVNAANQVWTLPGAGAVQVPEPRTVSTQPSIDPITSVTVTRASGKVETVKP